MRRRGRLLPSGYGSTVPAGAGTARPGKIEVIASKSLLSQKDLSDQDRIRLVRILEKINGKEAVKVLYELLLKSKGIVQIRVIKALVTCNYQAHALQQGPIDKIIIDQVRHLTWLLSCLDDLKASQTSKLLESALHIDFIKTKDTVDSRK